MQSVKLTKNLLILSSLILSACVKVPDIAICRDLHSKKIVEKDSLGNENITIKSNPVCMKEINESRCGLCVYTVSGKTQFVGEDTQYLLNGKPWSEVRLSGVLLPADSYVKVKEFIINTCKKSGDCQKDLVKWRTNIKSLDSK